MCTYLVWAASPEHDMRKKMAVKVILSCQTALILTLINNFKALMMFGFLMGTSYYLKRHKWSMIKSRKIVFTPKA